MRAAAAAAAPPAARAPIASCRAHVVSAAHQLQLQQRRSSSAYASSSGGGGGGGDASAQPPPAPALRPASAQPPPAPAQRPASGALWAQLVDWIDFFGGYAHEGLTLVDVAPASRCRGVVATADIPLERLARGPLLIVPQRLCLTAAAAGAKLSPALRQAGCGPLAALGAEQQVALLLASERAKGRASQWSPYIETLPDQPTCGWHLPPAALAAALASAGLDAAAWAPRVAAHRADVQASAADVADEYGDALEVGLDDYLWALATVACRAHGADAALAPAIDLLNHGRDASPPAAGSMEGDAPGGPETPVVCVNHYARGALAPLAAGRELRVAYDRAGGGAEEAFLRYAFVPPGGGGVSQ
jgi:hypothetical protein